MEALDRLQSKGLIVRRPSPFDARVNLISLTPAGLSARQHVLDIWSRTDALLCSRLPPGAGEALRGTLEQLRDAMLDVASSAAC